MWNDGLGTGPGIPESTVKVLRDDRGSGEGLFTIKKGGGCNEIKFEQRMVRREDFAGGRLGCYRWDSSRT